MITATMFVAQTVKPYPLLVVPNAKDDPSRAEFSDWNKPFEVTAPPDSMVIDPAEPEG